MDVFEQNSKQVWETYYPFIQQSKQYLSCQENGILLDLCLEIQSYNLGIKTQARYDFRKKELPKFFNRDGRNYNKKLLEEMANNKVQNYYRTSFDNKYSEEIKKLFIYEEFLHIKRANSSLAEEMQDYTDFEFAKKRKKIVRRLKKNLNLSKEFILALQQTAFNEILNLLKSELKIEHIQLITYLNTAIEIYFRIFLRDLGFKANVFSLTDLRLNTKQQYNTVCYRCYKYLFKKDNTHYCTQRENRSCYNARVKEIRNPILSSVILRTKNNCENCGCHASLDFIYKHRGVQRQFCSDRCWERYRKRDYRYRKKILFLASLVLFLSQKLMFIS